METKSIRELFMDKMYQLEELMENSEESNYDLESVHKLYVTLIENDQFIDNSPTEPYVSEKLIKSYRYIPNAYLDFFNVDRVVISGLFVMTKVYIIPANIIAQIYKENHGRIMNPEKYGLLPGSEVNYGTVKVHGHIATALMKNTWTDGWIDYASQYDYVTLG